jgi:hypothetical protein
MAREFTNGPMEATIRVFGREMIFIFFRAVRLGPEGGIR